MQCRVCHPDAQVGAPTFRASESNRKLYMTPSEQRTCQSCAQAFAITPDDLGFYEKMGVPAPNLCPGCRFKRRALWRNETMLYSRVCALCKKSILSMYHTASPYTVYCTDCYASDRWDPLSYGRAYDPGRPFFEQFDELLRAVPKAGIFSSSDVGPNIRSEYTNFAGGNKDCYMVFNSGPNNENCSYSRGIMGSHDAFDVYLGDELERCYEGVSVHRSAGVAWGQNVLDSIDSSFVRDGSGLQDCFGCVNLRHKSHHFLNEPLARGEYEKRVGDIRGSYSAMEKFRAQFEQFSLKLPRRENVNLKSVNVSGNYLFESKNCHDSFELSFCEDVRYSTFVKLAKDCQDILGHGRKSELLLEGVAVGVASRIIGGWWVQSSRDIAYSFGVRLSEQCFGCDSVRGAKFAILNKQYPEDEYQKHRTAIVGELKAKGIYGLYFPPEIAPFAYNETIGQDNVPLTKEEALAQGFRWQDDLQMTRDKETLKPGAIPDHIRDVKDSITNDILACVSCSRNYRITPAELQFYRAMVLPIPRRCFYCRHADRLRRRGPMMLFDRACDHCKKPIKTSYAPGRPEIVYCETCYQSEVV